MRTLRALLTLSALAAVAAPQGALARPRVFFTSRGDDLPGALMATFRTAEQRAAAGRPASIDLSVFSFTHQVIADELLRIAVAQPTVQVRIILDLGQISHSEGHMGPYIEDLQSHDWSNACRLRKPSITGAELDLCRADLDARYGATHLENVVVKYKWYDGYEWSASLKRPVLSHTRSLLMHRKLAIIDRDVVVGGSFNWSPQAANSNYENLLVLSGSAERGVAQEYVAEFDAMWANGDQFKTGVECRALRQVIWDRLRAANP